MTSLLEVENLSVTFGVGEAAVHALSRPNANTSSCQERIFMCSGNTSTHRPTRLALGYDDVHNCSSVFVRRRNVFTTEYQDVSHSTSSPELLEMGDAWLGRGGAPALALGWPGAVVFALSR